MLYICYYQCLYLWLVSNNHSTIGALPAYRLKLATYPSGADVHSLHHGPTFGVRAPLPFDVHHNVYIEYEKEECIGVRFGVVGGM